MSTTDTYITRLVLEDSQHAQATRRATANQQGLMNALSATSAAAGPMGVAIASALRIAAAAATAATAGLTALFVQASRSNAEFDSLMRGLTAVSGSAENANIQFQRLREVAKLPGLGLKEAIQGSTNLQAAGFSAGLAEAALAGFGNALATVGKGREDLFGVITALSQIAAKGKVSAEEINQIAERVPQIRKVMQEAFGTANTEELQKMGISSEEFVAKVTVALNKLPKATGGIANSFENLKDAAWQSLSALGAGVNSALAPIIDKVGNFLAFLSSSGIAKGIGDAFGNLLGGSDGSGLVRVLSYVVAGLEALPGIISTIATGAQSGLKAILDQARSLANFVIRAINIVSPVKLKPFENNEDLVMSGMGTMGLAIRRAVEGLQPRAMEIQKAFESSPGTNLAGPVVKTEGFMRAIKAATEKTASNTGKLVDAQRSVLGGNDLGRVGLAPVELGRIRRQTSNITVSASGAAKALESYIQGLIVDALRQAESGRRQTA